jgi:DNA replication protein DnaC
MLEQTRSQMSEMKLYGMLQSLDLRLGEALGQNWGAGDFISALVTDERSYRQASQINRRLKAASFRTQASFETLDHTAKRTLTKSVVRDLMQLQFVKLRKSSTYPVFAN